MRSRAERRKVDNKFTEYYLKGYRYHEIEKYLLLLTVTIHGVILILISSKDYVLHGKRKKGKGWYRAALTGAVMYVLPLWISVKYVSMSTLFGYIMGIALAVYIVAETGLVWRVNLDEQEEAEWNALWEDETQEEREKVRIEERSDEQKAEDEGWPGYRLQKMGSILSEKYCSYKYKRKMKESLTLTVMFEIILVCGIFVSAIIYESMMRWLIIGAGILVFALIGVTGYGRAVHKYGKLKSVASLGNMCEYGTVKADFYQKMRFVCADGHEEIWKMKQDDEEQIKDGEAAVVVYIPTAHMFCTEKIETINRILEE